MLDTNIASDMIKGSASQTRVRLAKLPLNSVVISVVTQAELLYGLARKGRPKPLAQLIREFLSRVDVLVWDSAAAEHYGDLRAACAALGITLSALDMMIAAHAVAAKATLVTRDKAFNFVPSNMFKVVQWID